MKAPLEITLRINGEVLAKGGKTLKELTMSRVIYYLSLRAYWLAQKVKNVEIEVQEVDKPETAILITSGLEVRGENPIGVTLADEQDIFCSMFFPNLIAAHEMVDGLKSLDFTKPCTAIIYHNGKVMRTQKMNYVEVQAPEFKSIVWKKRLRNLPSVICLN